MAERKRGGRRSKIEEEKSSVKRQSEKGEGGAQGESERKIKIKTAERRKKVGERRNEGGRKGKWKGRRFCILFLSLLGQSSLLCSPL